jgi:fructose-bisphosphate aldolase class II
VTKEVVNIAHAVGVSVEGEIGCLGSLETGMAEEEDGSGATGVLSHDQLLTSVEEARSFVAQTDVDALAIAIGTSHGAAKFKTPPTEQSLALWRLKELHEALPQTHFVLHGASSVPLELIELINAHGGSLPVTYGVPLESLIEAKKYGVRKINIDTDLRLAVTASIRQYFIHHPGIFDPRKYLTQARSAIKILCQQRFDALGSSGMACKIVPKPLSQMAQSYKARAAVSA